MNKTLILLATLATLGVASVPAGADDPFVASGSFLFGSPVAWGAIDACGNGGATEGIDSNCVPLEGDLSGKSVSFTMVDATGVTDPALCWYDAEGSFLDCSNEVVPVGSALLAVAALGGIQVTWEVTIV